MVLCAHLFSLFQPPIMKVGTNNHRKQTILVDIRFEITDLTHIKDTKLTDLR